VIRRLSTFAAAVSLILCVSLMVAGAVYTPGRFRNIDFGDGASGLSIGNGIISPHRNNRILLSVPIGALAVPFALPPLAWALSFYGRDRLRRRAKAGRCAGCGYALSGNVSGTCPECGTPVQAREGSAP
jgi:hypothetical protein